MQAERSLSELTRDLATQLSDLMRNEVRLARAETMETVKGMGGGVMRAATGLVIGGAAVTVALLGVAYLLGEAMPMWIAALLSAAIGGIAAYVLVTSGIKAIKKERVGLPRTAEQVSRDLRMIKEKAS
ncbi:MAG TPA: phage holin family protein [Vitreimonas sp.]|uniref:phage holin family protein n=1 Tax=Vitreimonas sp. TaxID=3069702 RepID=UPI002D5F4830|nr:phage holin family protein [Vitreimonas sp.]HYD86868.1 phage holin family protein [Vitreimonas sp.]